MNHKTRNQILDHGPISFIMVPRSILFPNSLFIGELKVFGSWQKTQEGKKESVAIMPITQRESLGLYVISKFRK